MYLSVDSGAMYFQIQLRNFDFGISSQNDVFDLHPRRSFFEESIGEARRIPKNRMGELNR